MKRWGMAPQGAGNLTLTGCARRSSMIGTKSGIPSVALDTATSSKIIGHEDFPTTVNRHGHLAKQAADEAVRALDGFVERRLPGARGVQDMASR